MTVRFLYDTFLTIMQALMLIAFGLLYILGRKNSNLWLACNAGLNLFIRLFESLSVYAGSFALSYYGVTFLINLLWQLAVTAVSFKTILSMEDLTLAPRERTGIGWYLASIVLAAVWEPTRGFYHFLLCGVRIWGIVRLWPLRNRRRHTQVLFWVLVITLLGQLANVYWQLHTQLADLPERALTERQNLGLLAFITLVGLAARLTELIWQYYLLIKQQTPSAAQGTEPLSAGERLDMLAQEYALTAREREILVLLNQGLSNQEIAQRTCTAEGTVKTHIYNIYKKFGVSRRAQLLARLTQG